MNPGSDVFTGSAPYEYTVVRRKDAKIRRRQVLLFLLYTVYCVAGLLGGATLFRLFAPLIALVPVTLWILVFFTWRWTQIEYDYSYFSGTLTVASVWGGRTRRPLCRIELRTVKALLSPGEACDEAVAAFAPERTLSALSAPDAERRHALLFTDENERRTLLWLETDTNAERIFRYYNSSVMKVRTQK